MKKEYIKPTIEVIKQIYSEGLMQTWSTSIGSGGGPQNPPPSGAKPDGMWDTASWGNAWTTTDPTPDLSNTYDKLNIPMN